MYIYMMLWLGSMKILHLPYYFKSRKIFISFTKTFTCTAEMGRRKIKMEMVQDMNTRQVTFSKRRTGLFKKASELATLCNAELGIVVFSPGGKPFSYGKPNLDSRVKKMSERLDSLNQEIGAEKELAEKAQRKLESVGDERFEKPIEELTLDELIEYMDKLEAVHARVKVQVNHMQVSSSLIILSRDN